MNKTRSIIILLLVFIVSTSLFSCSSGKDEETEKLRREIAELKKEKEDQKNSKPEDATATEIPESTPAPESAPKPAPPRQSEPGTAPKFSDYPAGDVFTGQNHPLVLDEFGKNFQSRLNEAIKNGKPTFAGQYIVAGWGCGSSGCNTGAIIDAKTGRAYPFPVNLISVTVEDANGEIQDFQDHQYKLNSRLMIFSGNLEGATVGDGSDTVEYYEFRDGKFIFIKSEPYGKSRP